MNDKQLNSINDYSSFITELLAHSNVKQSTVVVWSESKYTGVAEGDVIFLNGIRLRMREELDFDASLIASYGYEVYRGKERLYWYDDFPHPNSSFLAKTHPHHKHIHPDIKHNRIPAPEISFTRPNLPFIVKEIEELEK